MITNVSEYDIASIFRVSTYETTLYYNPDNHNLNIHARENLINIKTLKFLTRYAKETFFEIR